MNAWRQKISRSLKIAVDDLKMVVSFDEEKLQTVNIIKVKGLLLQGCILGPSKMLEEGGKNIPEFVQLPVLYVTFVSKNEKDAGSGTE